MSEDYVTVDDFVVTSEEQSLEEMINDYKENNDNENQSDSDSDGEQAETQELSKFAALDALKNIKTFLQQRKNSAEALLAATLKTRISTSHLAL